MNRKGKFILLIEIVLQNTITKEYFDSIFVSQKEYINFIALELKYQTFANN